MSWTDYQKAFEWDGSWRDIYVPSTDVSDWRKIIQLLRANDYRLKYSLDGEDSALPEQVERIFEERSQASPLLSINVNGVILNCHFFCVEEIEFDIDPREVDEKRKAESLLEFMAQVGQLLEKDVILTDENTQESVLFRYDSDAHKIKYNPIGE